jgi:hypothetical protein
MARLRGGLALLIGSAVVALAGCSNDPGASTGNLDTVQAVRAIDQRVREFYGGNAAVGPAECPKNVPFQKNLLFVCTIEIGDSLLVYRVLQTDGRGGVQVEPAQAVFSTNRIEAFVAAAARKTGRSVEDVACGGRSVTVRAPGTKVFCTVEYGSGPADAATLLVRDINGKLSLLPLEPASG